jgi:hypothetical protein
MFKFTGLLAFLISLSSHAGILRCQGDIGFWVASKPNQWKRVDISKVHVYEAFITEAPKMKIGKDKRFPAAEVSPFMGISAKVINQDLKFETDQISWFRAHYKNNQLFCEVTSGARD